MYFWNTIKLSEAKKDLEVSKIRRNKGILNKIYFKTSFSQPGHKKLKQSPQGVS